MAGAGIAGLTSALALARAGHAVRLVERRAEPYETGAGLQVSPNASHVLRDLGLDQPIKAVATRPRSLIVRRASTGERIGGMPMNSDNPAAPPFWSVMRQDLHAALAGAVRSEPLVSLETGKALEAGATGEPRLVGDGPPERVVDIPLIVGADGLWSQTRRLAGDPARPVFAGLEACRALVETTAVAAELVSDDIHLWLGHGFHCVHYPVDQGRLINLVFVRPAREPVEGWHGLRPAEALRAGLPDMSRALRQLVEAADTWNVWSLHDRPPTPPPSHDGIALIGDAAHPMLPFLAQGASMAIEDAAVLARLLPPPGDLDGPAVAAALTRFRQVRTPRVMRTVRTARGNARMYHLGFPAARARDLLMGALGPAGMRARHDWLYHWRCPP